MKIIRLLMVSALIISAAGPRAAFAAAPVVRQFRANVSPNAPLGKLTALPSHALLRHGPVNGLTTPVPGVSFTFDASKIVPANENVFGMPAGLPFLTPGNNGIVPQSLLPFGQPEAMLDNPQGSLDAAYDGKSLSSNSSASPVSGFVPVTRIIADLRALMETDKPAALAQAKEHLFNAAESRAELRAESFRVILELDRAAGIDAALKVLALPVRTKSAINLGLAAPDQEWYLKRMAANTLGAFAKEIPAGDREAAVAVLTTSYGHSHPAVRLAAGHALRELGVDPGPEKAPKVVAENPELSAHQKLAMQNLGPNAGRPKGNGFKWLIGIALISGLLWWGMGSHNSNQPPAKQPTQVEQVVAGDSAGVKTQPGAKDASKLEEPKTQAEQAAVDSSKLQKDTLTVDQKMLKQMERQNDLIEKALKPKPTNVFGTLLQLAMFGIMAFFLFIMIKGMRGGGGAGGLGGFTKTKGEVERPTTRFTDVAGMDESRVEVEEIIAFLKDPAKYRRMGAKIPKGVLMHGPPGTGKTLLAKAVAGESGAAFFSMSGSDFVEMFVGVGASRVRDLFKKAAGHKPAIIFIDEIDAVGKQRGGNTPGGANDEREGTLNAMLKEMDGFDSSDGIIIMAATNQVDTLDKALIRPGRFDRQVYVGLPEVRGREAILFIHALLRKSRLDWNVDLQFVAQRTMGMSGAYLEGLLNEAALLAVRRGADAIGPEDIDEAVDRVTIGGKRSLLLSPELKRLISRHEAGHVVANLKGKKPTPVNKVTNVPHGAGALGFAESGAEEGDKYLYTKAELEARIDTAMGGLVAEKLYYGEWSTGPGSDLEQASNVARAMVERFGMSAKLGKAVLADPKGMFHRQVSEITARLVDVEVQGILEASERRVTANFEANRAALDALTEALFKQETLHRQEIEKIVLGGPLKP